MTPRKYRFYNLPYAIQGVTFVAIVTLTRTRVLTLRKGQASQADLAIERERQLITTRANQITGLTNGSVANWALEVKISPFRALSRRQMTFPFCC